MSLQFVHLHVHSHFSLLDGASSPDELVRRAKELGMSALALTDHGALHGSIQFAQAASAAGVRPIFGCELPGEWGRLTLLAETDEGYANLCRLSSAGFTYREERRRLNLDELSRNRRGLIALAGGQRNEIGAHLAAGDEEGAFHAAAPLRELFGPDHFFLELVDHGSETDRRINQGLFALQRRLGSPLVATNDVYHARAEEYPVRSLLRSIGGRPLDPADRSAREAYLKSPAEMASLFAEAGDTLRETLRIAERCHANPLVWRSRLPAFSSTDGEPAREQLRRLVFKGAHARYGAPLSAAVTERIEYELRLIAEMGYDDYFLIVWDLVRFAKESGIPVGPGRGSAAASIVAYALRITDVDPLAYALPFERFLNPERVSMPDIDVDLCYARRDEVIEYVIRRYGRERVAHICAFATLTAKAAVRDVGRILGVAPDQVDRVARQIPPGPGVLLTEAIAKSPQLREASRSSGVEGRLLQLASAVQGRPRHLTVHAAGIVITEEAVGGPLPVCVAEGGVVVSQYPGEDLERLGFLKMDLLGLRTLTAIDMALNALPASTRDRLSRAFPLDDPRVYDHLSRGMTESLFQVETEMFKGLLKEVKPRNLADLAAVLALGRPGPMATFRSEWRGRELEQVEDRDRGRADDRGPSRGQSRGQSRDQGRDQGLDQGRGRGLERDRNRDGKGGLEAIHPKVRAILAETKGLLLYQEQVMAIATELAGYSPGGADLLRRAMAKKDPDAMQREKPRFVEGCVARGLSRAAAESLFAALAQFAEYGFPKSHAVAYALLTYKTAYLKVHHPAQWMAAQMSTVMSSTERVGRYVRESRRLGLTVHPPDINLSDVAFKARDGAVYYGLAAVKHVGESFAANVAAIRAQKAYASLTEFLARVPRPGAHRRAIESLVRVGAFDAVAGGRVRALAEFERLMGASGQGTTAGRFGLDPLGSQVSLFPMDQPVAAESDTGTDLGEVDQAGVDQAGVDQADVGQADTVQPDVDQAGVDQADIDPENIGQTGVDTENGGQAGVNPENGGQTGVGPENVDQVNVEPDDVDHDRLRDEIELLGVHLTIDPLQPYRPWIERWSAPPEETRTRGATWILCGVVVAMRRSRGRSGEETTFLVVEDARGGLTEVLVYPNVRQRSARLDLGCVVAVTGRIRGEEGGVRLIASDLKRVAGSPAEIVATETADLQRIRETAARHPGGRPLLLRLEGSHYRAALILPPPFWVDPHPTTLDGAPIKRYS